MSAQRAVPSTTAPLAPLRLIAVLVLGIALGAAGALLLTARTTDPARRRVMARIYSPDKSRVAVALEAPCAEGFCQELRLGSTQEASQVVSSLTNRTCGEIAWTRDGTRVAFVIDGSEMAVYDVQTAKLAGIVRLLTSEAALTRIARGVTFSENGRAATFDDCPRTQSGCRAGVVGVPQ
jgi:hypothetical protein